MKTAAEHLEAAEEALAVAKSTHHEGRWLADADRDRWMRIAQTHVEIAHAIQGAQRLSGWPDPRPTY